MGQALEVIPRTLAQNCGANVIRVLTKLRSQHGSDERCTMGLNGHTGLPLAQDGRVWPCAGIGHVCCQ